MSQPSEPTIHEVERPYTSWDGKDDTPPASSTAMVFKFQIHNKEGKPQPLDVGAFFLGFCMPLLVIEALDSMMGDSHYPMILAFFSNSVMEMTTEKMVTRLREYLTERECTLSKDRCNTHYVVRYPKLCQMSDRCQYYGVFPLDFFKMLTGESYRAKTRCWVPDCTMTDQLKALEYGVVPVETMTELWRQKFYPEGYITSLIKVRKDYDSLQSVNKLGQLVDFETFVSKKRKERDDERNIENSLHFLQLKTPSKKGEMGLDDLESALAETTVKKPRRV